MSTCRSTFASGVALASLVWAGSAHAQACCAGAGAVTPGRLTPYELVLVGLQSKSSVAFGSFDSRATYGANAPGSGEADLEQDLFGAVRILKRGQLSLLAPLVETWRTTRSTGGELGGGLGDINVSGRADFVEAGESRYVPGIALLAGLTVPSGRAPDQATHALATDATGVGAWQGNFGLAVEQNFGHWLVNLTGLVAFRSARTVGPVSEVLGAQLTALGALGYSFQKDSAIALLVSYTGEGDATINGATEPWTSRQLLRISVSGVYPFSDTWRLQGGLFFDPPIDWLGRNNSASMGLTLSIIRSWT